MSDRDDEPPPPAGRRLVAPESLCHACAGCRYVQGRATTFVLCTVLAEKYPRQPVRACDGFSPRS